METLSVTFQPSGRTVKVAPGTLVIDAAKDAGIKLKTPCGGGGTCGKCLVRFTKGAPEEGSRNKEDLALGYHRACSSRLDGNAVILVPEASQFEAETRVLVHENSAQHPAPNPSLRKVVYTLDAASQHDSRSDLDRLRQHCGPDLDIAPRVLPELPHALRSGDWTVTAIIHEGIIVGLEPGDTSGRLLGVAIDLGTTTMAASLHDLQTGQRLATASDVNQQVSFGDDVLSRITAAMTPAGAIKLREAASTTINGLLAELSSKADIDRKQIYHMVVAGNTTMQQLLLGIDCAPLAEIPFVQAFGEARTVTANSLSIEAAPSAQVTLLPQIGGFVGGDTTAGLLAALPNLPKGESFVFVDIGTNGEIVASDGSHMVATSAAAGPAFEGARIACGMRAAPGAIESVTIEEGEVTLSVIGNTKPIGLCGTALIDIAAELLRAGILDPTGRMVDAEELPTDLPDSLRQRIVAADDGQAFVLATASESGTGTDLLLYQRDIRELQLASGAIRAAVSLVLKRLGLDHTPTYLLAGAFGNYIDPVNATRMGLLPAVEGGEVRFIGNTAHAGAQAALLCRDNLEWAGRLRSQVEHLALSTDPEFQMEFAMAMMFPE